MADYLHRKSHTHQRAREALRKAGHNGSLQKIDALVYAIEVETEGGVIGLIHANVPVADWSDLGEALLFDRHVRDMAMWDRGRIESQDTSGVAGIKAVVVGHTPLRDAVCLGNVFHIDTGGWAANGHFTLLDLSTLGAA